MVGWLFTVQGLAKRGRFTGGLSQAQHYLHEAAEPMDKCLLGCQRPQLMFGSGQS